MNRKEMRIIYTGTVQGVGFRWTVKNVSCGYEVVGFVRNLPQGSVELIAQGKQTELEEFAQAIRDSGMGPLIRNEEISWAPVPDPGDPRHGRCYKGFEIA